MYNSFEYLYDIHDVCVKHIQHIPWEWTTGIGQWQGIKNYTIGARQLVFHNLFGIWSELFFHSCFFFCEKLFTDEMRNSMFLVISICLGMYTKMYILQLHIHTHTHPHNIPTFFPKNEKPLHISIYLYVIYGKIHSFLPFTKVCVANNFWWS